MQQFTNKFSVAVNQQQTEVLLNFYQDVPEFMLNGEPMEKSINDQVQSEPVSSLVMTYEFAEKFSKLFQDILHPEK